MKRFSFMLAVLLLGTGGCQDDPTTTPDAPSAAFTVGGTRQAGQAVTFDASTSTDPGGGGLTYTWTFGDGAQGGTPTVAHLYRQAGAYTVKLTVQDAELNTATATRTVNIAAGPVSPGTAELSGRVTRADGTPLAGVSVTAVGSAASALTAADGGVTLTGVPAGVPLVLRLALAGYANGSARLDPLPSGATDGWFQAALAPRAPPVILASAQAGGTVSGAAGAKAGFPANGLVRADGSAATGAVEVSITPVDVANAIDAFPGPFTGVQANGTSTPIASYGVMEVVLSQGGQPLQVAPGKGVTLEIPVYTGGAALGQTIPLWSLDEVSGTWVQEGTGTVVASAGSPTGLAMRAVVAHLSWWNIDTPYQPYTVRVLCMTEADPQPLPSTDYCFVEASQEGDGEPQVSGKELLPPGVRTALDIYPGVPTRFTGTSGSDPSLTVSVLIANPTIGGSQDLDLVLPAGDPSDEPAELVAVGGPGAPTIVTFDGTRWQARVSPFDDAGGLAIAVASSGMMWVAGGRSSSGPLATSADGVSWTPAAFGTSADTVMGLGWNGSMWVAVGTRSPGALFATSPDGVTWTPADSLPGPSQGFFVAWNGTYWLAGTAKDIVRSDNGRVWRKLTEQPFAGGGAVHSGAWNGSHWVVVGFTPTGSAVAISPDGVNWTTRYDVVPQARSVGWNGTTWMVGGLGAVATSPTTATWTLRSPAGMVPHGLAWTGTMWVAAGHPFVTNGALMTSLDGGAWTPVATPFPAMGRGVAAKRPLYPPLP